MSPEVVAGDSAYAAEGLPVVAIAIRCETVLGIDRDASGRIGISLTVRDKDGRVIVDIDRGRFEVNKNNYFRIDRQGSRSTLSVTDQFKTEVLYLNLYNRNC